MNEEVKKVEIELEELKTVIAKARKDVPFLFGISCWFELSCFIASAVVAVIVVVFVVLVVVCCW